MENFLMLIILVCLAAALVVLTKVKGDLKIIQAQLNTIKENLNKILGEE